MDDRMSARNRRTAIALSLAGVGMFGFGFALAPLYSLVCDLLGIQSATAAVPAAPGPATSLAAAPERLVTVKFDAGVRSDLPWEFAPETASVTVPVGVSHKVVFNARNHAGVPIVGQAIPNVAPWQASPHFKKAECFCFERQTLAPGEAKAMPLVFMVSPDLPAGIDSLTLSYTFMNASAAGATR